MKKRFDRARLLFGLASLLIPSILLATTSTSSAIVDPVARDKSQHKLTAHQAAPSAPFTVTNNNDTGPGSLRDAIDQANLTPGADLITFNLAGSRTIDVLSPLPVISEAVTIDGGSPRVELNGTGVPKGNALTILASNVTVRGLVVNRFNTGGIEILGGVNGCVMQGNFIGTDATGTAALANGGAGVFIDAFTSTIGGPSLADRNIISGNNGAGIELSSQSAENSIQGNFIGTDVSGTGAVGNGGGGIIADGGANSSFIGSNVIANNSGNGVTIFGGAANSIMGNSIFSNSGLGIDLSDDGSVTPNDMCDSDGGANNQQNFPVLTSATSNGAATTVLGSLDSTPGGSYTIEFFSNSACDGSGFGEGRTFIGSTVVMNGCTCVVPINVVLPVSIGSGVITATATNETGDTSEFSACVNVVAVVSGSDLQITNSDSPDPVLAGSNITYAIGITNNGPDPDAGVVFSDTVPAGTTFVSLTSPGSCSTPPPGGTGSISCSLGALGSGVSIPITLVVNVNAAPGATITNTATVSGMSADSNPANNSAGATTTVTSMGCTLTCPPDRMAFTSPNASSCAAVVTYSPATSSACGAVNCAPPSGSAFPVGTTTVSCTAAGGPNCSFTVTVLDSTPPTITCPTGFTTTLPPGQSSGVVNYPSADATDNCTVTSVVCTPPSGSTFPAGSTLVMCSATDAFNNASNCFFLVTLLDGEVPVISCPANVNASLPAGQTSTVVSYPPPTVSDNFPGVSVACSPRSGSVFSAGTTTVICTAIDKGGNSSSCSFVVSVGGAQAKTTLPGNKTSIEFAASPSRKAPKPNKNPCTPFTIENVGFAPLVLTLDSIARTGGSVDNGRITDPNDTRFFTLSVVNPDESERVLDIGAGLTVQPGQAQNLCVRFAALLPALAGKTTGLAASNVLPDVVTSKIVFRQNAGANISIPLVARVSTQVMLVNLLNPRAKPEVVFTRSGNDITVSYVVFDSNLDVTRAKYEFLDDSDQVVAGPFDIDLASPISAANLVRGQSFSVDQRFTGANGSPSITSVRVTVFDGETSVVAPSASATSISAANIELMTRKGRVTLYPPDTKLR